MDHYHEDLICVLNEIKLHHLELVDRNFNHWTLVGEVIEDDWWYRWNYHRDRANFIQSELDRLAEKYK